MLKYLARNYLLAGIITLLCTLFTHEVHAWGDTAHKIICEIAFKELNSQARSEVKRLTQASIRLAHLLNQVLGRQTERDPMPTIRYRPGR